MTRILAGSYRFIDETKQCPTCHAEPKVWCVNPITGETRRVPCVKRPRITSVEPTVSDLQGRPGSSCLAAADIAAEVDFTEPRHRAEPAPDGYPHLNPEYLTCELPAESDRGESA